MRAVLSFGCVLAGIVCEAALVQECATVVDFGTLKLHLEGPKTIRVTHSLNSTVPPRIASSVTRAWPTPIPYSRTDNSDGTVSITTTSITATVDPKTASVSFSRNGSTLLSEIGREISPVSDYDGSQGFKTVQRWQLEGGPDEALFGGGSHQQNMLNFRSTSMNLVQHNTEAAVPVFMSSSGFGLLWDSTSEVWLNEPRDIAKMVSCSDGSESFEFSPSATGRHGFTANLGSTEFISHPVTGCKLEWSDGAQSGVVFDHTDTTNMPPVVSGAVHLSEGTKYTLTWTTEPSTCESGFKAPLYVTLPGRNFSLTSLLDEFIDYTFFGGESIDESVMLYREASGAAPMFAKWVYGFWQCKEHYATQQELLDAAMNFRQRNLPLDAIVQDWRYWGGDDNWGPVWNNATYPDPVGLVKKLHDSNVHLMVSVWAKFKNAGCLKALRDSNDALVDKNPDHYMDAWDPATRQTYFSLINRSMFSIGVDAIWLDGSEPEGWPNRNETLFPNGRNAPGVSGNRLMNGYSLGETTAVHDGLTRNYPNMRPFTLTRASWAGQQRTGGVLWSGDIKSTWPVLRRQVVASLNFALSGMPYWSEDIGGFFRPNNQYLDEDFKALLTRWFQFGAFTPVFRTHGTNGANSTFGTEYWLYGEETLSNINATNTLRHRLMPYLYSLAYMTEVNGYTMQRHFGFDFPHDETALTIEDEFMFGPALLVAPVVSQNDSDAGEREVYLPTVPSGEWICFYEGVSHAPGSTMNAAAPLSHIPLFGRPGSILILGPKMQSVYETYDTLEVRIFPGADAHFELYEDDGKTRDYTTKSSYSIIKFLYSDKNGTLTVEEREGSFPGMLPNRTFNVIMVRKGRGVGLDAESNPDFSKIYSGNRIEFTFSA